jgi:hypothetical protein
MVLPDDRRGDCSWGSLADVLLPGLLAVWLRRPAHARPTSGRRNLRAHSVVVLPAVLAQRALREARNVDGGTAITTRRAGGTRRLQANWRGMSFDACRTQDRKRAARAVVRRTERVQVILPADELAAIEEFRFQARMPSRSAAVRELLRRGMARASRAGGARLTPRSRGSKC